MQPVSPQQEHLSDAGKMGVIPPQRLQQVGERRASVGFPVANTLNVMVTLSFGNETGTSRRNHSLDLTFNVPTAVLQSGYPGRSVEERYMS